jgi:serine/threonine-protein kinase
MVYLAPATFKMGDGKAAREVTLSRGYFLDREEVSVRQYAACVTKRLCTAANRVTLAPATTPDDQDADEHASDSPADPPTQVAAGSPDFVETWSRACNEPRKASDHPINCVDYESAAAFCRFKGRRLPTEAEWELAARGTAGRAFPWGPEPPDCQRACLDKNASCRPAGEGVVTCGVNKHAADRTPEGIADLGGNVSEWVADGFATQIPGGRDPVGNASSMLRVVRGGNFVDGADRARAGWRGGLPAGTALATVGFRCAMDAPY